MACDSTAPTLRHPNIVDLDLQTSEKVDPLTFYGQSSTIFYFFSAALQLVFTEMEVAAQYVHHSQLYSIFGLLIYVITMPFSSTPPTVLSVSHIRVCCFFPFL